MADPITGCSRGQSNNMDQLTTIGTKGQDVAQLTTIGTKGQDVAQLLRDVFQAHMEAITSMESKVQELQKKCGRQERLNAQLLRKGRDLQTHYDDLAVECETVKRDLMESKTQLSMPCTNCEILRGQLEQQEKLYQMVMCTIGTDKHRTSNDKHGTGSDKQIASGSMMSPEKTVEKSTHITVYEAAYQDTINHNGNEDSCSQSQTLLQSNNSTHRINQSEIGSHQIDQLGTGLQEDVPGEDTSPGSGKGKSLKLARNTKRSRTKYTEETFPETKKYKHYLLEKSDISDSSMYDNQGEFVLQPIETQFPDRHDYTTNILAPETCDPDATTVIQNATKKKKHVNFHDVEEEVVSRTASKQCQIASERPDIVIPETMAFDYYDVEEHCSSGDEHQGAACGEKSDNKSDTQVAVVHVALTPPSCTSTPVTSDQSCLALKQKTVSCHNQSDASPPRHMTGCHDSMMSEHSSPVFGRSKDLLQKSTLSPSLFDDDDHGDPSKEMKHTKDSPLSKRFLFKDLTKSKENEVISVRKMTDVYDVSPSMLSGRRLAQATRHVPVSSTEQADYSKGLDQAESLQRRAANQSVGISPRLKSLVGVGNTSKKSKSLIQTTLKLTGTHPMRAQSLDNQTFDDDVNQTFDDVVTRDFHEVEDPSCNFVPEKTSTVMSSRYEDGDEEILTLIPDNSTNQDFPRDRSSCDTEATCDMTFSKPQFTSTQRKNRSPKSGFHPIKETQTNFKKPLLPVKWSKMRKNKSEKIKVDLDLTRDMCDEAQEQTLPETAGSGAMEANDMNGTIDPNAHLSQYESQYSTPPDDKQEDKSTAVVDNDGEHYRESGNNDRNNLQLKRSSQGQTQATQTRSRRSNRILSDNKTVAELQQSEDIPDSAKSVVFGARSGSGGKCSKVTSSRSRTSQRSDAGIEEDSCQEYTTCPDEDDNVSFHQENSFDRVPKKSSGPGYAYIDVVRKKDERQKLQSFACQQCEEYFSGMDLSDAERKERMKHCRHKARYMRPSTPEHYWSLDFPDTQEAEERGYLNTTQAQPSKFRRRHGFRPLFLEGQGDNNNSKK